MKEFDYIIVGGGCAGLSLAYEFEINENEKRREIDVLKEGFIQTFVNDLRDVSRYSRSSSFITDQLARTEIGDLTN